MQIQQVIPFQLTRRFDDLVCSDQLVGPDFDVTCVLYRRRYNRLRVVSDFSKVMTRSKAVFAHDHHAEGCWLWNGKKVT